MLRNPLKLQTYNDGFVLIYATVAPRTIDSTPKKMLRFHRRTIGMKRIVDNAQVNVEIAHLLRCPLVRDVSTQDIAALDGVQYKIARIQYPEDAPLSMDLTLEEVQAKYEYANPGE